MGKETTYKRPSGLLDSEGKYFERARPQYEDRSVGDFVSLKNFGAKGKNPDSGLLESADFARRWCIRRHKRGPKCLERGCGKDLACRCWYLCPYSDCDCAEWE